MKNFLPVAAYIMVVAVTLIHRYSGEPPGKSDRLPDLLRDSVFQDDLRRSLRRGLGGIAVVAPSSGLRGEDIEKAYSYAAQLGIAFPREALDAAAVPYTANRDDKRLALFATAMADPDIEVLWALRGGYGSGRLLADLAATATATSPKVFIGYSDATFLHLFLQRLGWKTVHGAMFWEIGAKNVDPANFRLLATLLAGKTNELVYDGIQPFNSAARECAGPIHGAITGGNLTCLAAATGTPWPVDAKGGILFIEDVKEGGYKIDRMLTQLASSGAFDSVEAVLLGTFTAGDEHTEFALERFASQCGKPVFRCNLFGHGVKNYPLIFNVPSTLERATGNLDDFRLRIPAAGFPNNLSE